MDRPAPELELLRAEVAALSRRVAALEVRHSREVAGRAVGIALAKDRGVLSKTTVLEHALRHWGAGKPARGTAKQIAGGCGLSESQVRRILRALPGVRDSRD